VKYSTPQCNALDVTNDSLQQKVSVQANISFLCSQTNGVLFLEIYLSAEFRSNCIYQVLLEICWFSCVRSRLELNFAER